MITNVFAAIAADMLAVGSRDGFFKAPKKTRVSHINDAFGEYPRSLVDYLSAAEDEKFASDFKALAPIFGTRESSMGQIPALKQTGNGIFEAFLTFLQEDFLDLIKEVPKNTESHLFNELRSVLGKGNTDAFYHNTLLREAQEFLLQGRGIDSPRAHIPTELDSKDEQQFLAALKKKTGGIPSIRTNKTLLGGVRIFQNGRVTDESWKSRITHLFSQL